MHRILSEKYNHKPHNSVAKFFGKANKSGNDAESTGNAKQRANQSIDYGVGHGSSLDTANNSKCG